MAITKEVKYDKIEVVGDYKAVQCRQATIVKETDIKRYKDVYGRVS